jgi:hypothetical protein
VSERQRAREGEREQRAAIGGEEMAVCVCVCVCVRCFERIIFTNYQEGRREARREGGRERDTESSALL